MKPNDHIQLNHDNYEILEILGSGGQGIVWKVRRQSDDALVALKSINIFQSEQLYKKQRKPTEIKALVKYALEEITFLESLTSTAEKHHIVICLDKGVFKDPIHGELPLIVMPLYDHDLDQYLYDFHGGKPWSFSIDDLLKWMQQTAAALAFIHQQSDKTTPSPVHRDIKPANLMLNQHGDIGLTDFGIARTSNTVGTSSIAAIDSQILGCTKNR
jgi:serine/threonine-protein kinase